MSNRSLQVGAQRAADVCRHVELDPAATALLTPTATPGEFVAALLDAGHAQDAAKFLAHAMGRREAVWWAVQCVRSVLRPPVPPPVQEALRATEAWVYQPSEENRWACEAAATATKLEHPAGWAAMAAFWSGASLTRPMVLVQGQPPTPPVPPGPFLTAKAAGNAVIIAAVSVDPQPPEGVLPTFVARGIEIANAAAARS
jgi:hypothetical protein